MTAARAHPLYLAWFCVAAVVTSATQLRVPGTPVGPGELLAVAWLAVAAARVALGGTMRATETTRVVLGFWALALPMLGIGAVIVSRLGYYNPAAGHDTLSFLFLPALLAGLLLTVEMEREAPRAAAVVVWTLAGIMVPLFFLSLAAPQLGPVELWYTIRFRGWAENPNQLALALSAVPFLALYLARRSAGRLRAAYYLLAGGSVLVGAATLSDGLIVAWVGALGVVGVAAWGRALVRRHAGVLPAAVPYVLVPLAALSGLALAGPMLASTVSGQLMAIYSTSGQGETRFTLWRNGLAAVESSPLFGLGPGAHSGYGGPHEGLEVHNTMLDWLGNTGFVGLSLFLAVLGWTVARVLRRRSLTALGALVSLLSISAFHHVMRHPIFWLSLIVTANLPWPDEPERNTAAAPRPAPAGPPA